MTAIRIGWACSHVIIAAATLRYLISLYMIWKIAKYFLTQPNDVAAFRESLILIVVISK